MSKYEIKRLLASKFSAFLRSIIVQGRGALREVAARGLPKSLPLGPVIGALVLPLFLPSGAHSNDSQWCKLDDPVNQDSCPSPRSAFSLESEVALPLPCGRKMVFRKVQVPANTLLDFREGYVGLIASDASESQNLSYREKLVFGPTQARVGGAFSEDKDENGLIGDYEALGFRSYYIGKYEMTRAQYQIMIDGLFNKGPEVADKNHPDCKSYKKKVNSRKFHGASAAGGISWFDAVSYARLFNRWLSQLEAEQIKQGENSPLPWEQGSPGFVRLPTLAEWSFAAYGGANLYPEAPSIQKFYLVEKADGSTRQPQLQEIAWASDGVGRNTKFLHDVGQKLPNLLGLYDLLGNASELLHEHFQLSLPDQTFHGQVGAPMAIGGSLETYPEDMSLGYKVELPPFAAGKEQRYPDVGVRFIISAPIIVTGVAKNDRKKRLIHPKKFQKNLLSARRELIEGEERSDQAEDSRIRKKIQEEFSALREDLSSDNQAQSQRLGLIQEKLDAAQASVNIERKKLAKAQIRSVFTTFFSLSLQGKQVYLVAEKAQKRQAYQQENQGKFENNAKEKKFRSATKTVVKTLDRQIASYDEIAREYQSNLRESAALDKKSLSRLLKEIKKEHELRGLSKVYSRAYDIITDHINLFKKTNNAPNEKQVKKLVRDVDRFQDKRVKLMKKIKR